MCFDQQFVLLLTNLHPNDFTVDEAVNHTMTNTCHSSEFVTLLLLSFPSLQLNCQSMFCNVFVFRRKYIKAQLNFMLGCKISQITRWSNLIV